MGRHGKKVVVIMLMGLLLAGPFALLHHAAAQQESLQMVSAAKAANDKAAATLHQTMMEMDATSKMPMTANEKAMMKAIHDLATVVQMLIDSNKNLITVVEHGTK
ncbi:MAG TPA: hypothetical protein VFL28_16990 [bacterium]|nr:hypothetical protein [bacterium]